MLSKKETRIKVKVSGPASVTKHFQRYPALVIGEKENDKYCSAIRIYVGNVTHIYLIV